MDKADATTSAILQNKRTARDKNGTVITKPMREEKAGRIAATLHRQRM